MTLAWFCAAKSSPATSPAARSHGLKVRSSLLHPSLFKSHLTHRAERLKHLAAMNLLVMHGLERSTRQKRTADVEGGRSR